MRSSPVGGDYEAKGSVAAGHRQRRGLESGNGQRDEVDFVFGRLLAALRFALFFFGVV